MLPPPSKERVGKMDEVKNANFSFNKKSYVDNILQKRRFRKHASEKVIPKNVLQRGYTETKKSTNKNTLKTNQL